MGACIHGLAIVMLFVFYNPLQRHTAAQSIASLRKVDWLGAFLLAAGLGMFMTGLTLGATSSTWTSATVLGPLCAGAGALVVLAVHQIFVNKHGILDHDLFTRNFCVGKSGFIKCSSRQVGH